MEQKDTSQISAFDTLFSNNHIQMLKVLLPYMDNQFQKYLAIYIKFQELQVALNFVRKRPYPLCGCMIRPDDTDPAQVVKRPSSPMHEGRKRTAEPDSEGFAIHVAISGDDAYHGTDEGFHAGRGFFFSFEHDGYADGNADPRAEADVRSVLCHG